MPRVTDQDVKNLIQTDRDTCDPFIRIASHLVDTHLVSKISDIDLLEHIELYLAAHFTAVTEERGALIRNALGESAETYQDLYKPGLRSTRFGQQAIALDHTGTLQVLSMTDAKAEFRIL